MAVLVPDIWHMVVDCLVWERARQEPGEDYWAGGDLRIHLLPFHPLRDVIMSYELDEEDVVERAFEALGNTSSTLASICEPIISRNVLCELSAPNRDDATPSSLAVKCTRSLPGLRTKMMDVSVLEESALSGLSAESTPLSHQLLDAPGQCAALIALSMDEETIGWLRPILAALPGGPNQLRQLLLHVPKAGDTLINGYFAAYRAAFGFHPEFEEDSEGSERTSNAALAVVGECGSLEVMSAEGWEVELRGGFLPSPDELAPRYFSLFDNLGTSALKYLSLSKFADIIAQDPLVRDLPGEGRIEPLIRHCPTSLVRLHLDRVHLGAGLATLIESSHCTLEFLQVSECSMGASYPNAMEPPEREIVIFDRLAHVEIAPSEGLIKPELLPPHWRTPVLKSLTVQSALVIRLDDVEILRRTVLDVLPPSLEYLRVVVAVRPGPRETSGEPESWDRIAGKAWVEEINRELGERGKAQRGPRLEDRDGEGS